MEDVIWEAKLDGVWDCMVIRTAERFGKLLISRDGVAVHTEKVGLSYGAAFGPDVSDVDAWCQICSEFVDSRG